MLLVGVVVWASTNGVPSQRMSRKRVNQANRIFAVDICTPTGTEVTVPPEMRRRKLKLFMGAIGIRNRKNWSVSGEKRIERSTVSWQLLRAACRRASSRRQ